MFRLKDILYLCEHGLKDAVFIPVDVSKCGVEVRDGVAGFVQPATMPNKFDPVLDHPDVVDEWVNEYKPETVDDKGNITYAESYLYALEPFYREVVDFYWNDEILSAGQT